MQFQNDKLRCTLTQVDDAFTLAVDDLISNVRWGESPLLVLEVYDKAQFRVETLTKFRIDLVEELPDGVHIVVGDGFRRLQIGVWIRLIGGELSVTVPPVELYESKTAVYRTFSVIILPGMMRAERGGTLVLPLNTGVLCDPSNKPKLADRFMIYGEQSRWELMPTLPIGAVQTPAGGMMALATSGASDMECHVATDGNGGGEIGFGVSFRQNWPDPVDIEQRELRFIPIPPRADPVLFVAKRLRRHVMDDLGKPTLVQRAEESPEVAYLLNAYIMKLFFAVENEGIMMYDQAKTDNITFKQVMNFAEAGCALRKLRDGGIDKVLTEMVGWNPRGHDGLWPTRFPIEARLGGEAGLRDLITLGHDLGYHMNVHDNYLSAYRNSPDFNEDLLIHDMYGQPMGLGEWGGGITYIHWALGMPEERLHGEMRKVKALGIRGVFYIDGMGNPLYRDYLPRHRGTRGGYAKGTQRIIEAAKEIFGAAGTECGFIYAALPADSMGTAGAEWHMRLCSPEWPVTALQDKRVPIWQLAMHGLIVLENHGENWASTMRSVLFGDHPRTEWSAHPGIMPVLDDAMVRVLKAKYDIALRQFGYLQTLEMTNYQQLAEQVEKTTFADGTEVIADFSKQELLVNGKLIDCPEALKETVTA